jgi:hypothetical protein
MAQVLTPALLPLSMDVTPASLAKLEDCLLNTSGEHPLHNRFRALFTLKALGAKAIPIVAKGTSCWLARLLRSSEERERHAGKLVLA